MTAAPSRRAALGMFAAAGATAVSPAATAKEDTLVTSEQMAVLEFQPWLGKPDFVGVGKCEAVIASHFPTFRIAYGLMFKTKAELEGIVRSLDKTDEGSEGLIDMIATAATVFKEACDLFQAAECRMMSAYASVLKQDDPEEFTKS